MKEESEHRKKPSIALVISGLKKKLEPVVQQPLSAYLAELMRRLKRSESEEKRPPS
jgi:hypothetical protein